MKSIFLLTLGLFLCIPVTAQKQDRNEIAGLKIAFITNALDLNTNEAQEFWVIYNKYEEKSDALRAEMHCGIYDKLKTVESIPDEAAKELLQNYMELRREEYKLRENYVAELKKVISAKRIMMLKKAEYDFHRKLLEKYRSGDKKKK